VSRRAPTRGDGPPPPGRADEPPSRADGVPRSRGPRRLAEPRAVRVGAAADGRPEKISGRRVDAVRESWLVEDRWWTDAPVRRRYWEVVTGDGRNLVVFHDLEREGWFAQR
jgi:hypothetical protein